MDLSPLWNNPVVLGALITTGLNAVKPILAKVDSGKLAEPYTNILHILRIVCTFAVSVIDLVVNGKLQTLDLQAVVNFFQFYLPALIGAKAMTISSPKPATPVTGNPPANVSK